MEQVCKRLRGSFLPLLSSNRSQANPFPTPPGFGTKLRDWAGSQTSNPPGPGSTSNPCTRLVM
eukprot:1901326-Amphidinium_carterae.1